MSVDLLHPVLIICRFSFQFLAGLTRIFQLSLVQVTATSSGRQVLLQLPDGHSHLLQLSMVFLKRQKRGTGTKLKINTLEYISSERNSIKF